MTNEQKGYTQLILYSLFVGSIGVFVKLVKELDVYSIVFFRVFIAMIFIFFILTLQKRLKELHIVDFKRTILTGLLQGLSMFFYFGAILNTSVSNAIFLLYTAPIFSVFLARVFLKEKIEKETIVGVCVTILGIIFILDPTTFSFSSKETLGNLMGLVGGFFYSAMAITAKPVLKKVSGYNITFWQQFIISLMFLPFLKVGSMDIIYANWWQLGIIGIPCTGIAFILFMEGVKKVKAQKIFIITSLETLVGTILALIILKEIPSMFTIIGALLIFYGVYFVTKNKIS